MPPKPRMVIRKPSNAVNSEQPKNVTAPTPKAPPPQNSNLILLPEVNALETSYKDIMIATGRVFQYYSDARKERVTHYSPYPPVSIRHALIRSLEKYDQICDTIEIRIQHSIAVLQRDIKELKARLKAEEEESARKPVFSPSITPVLLPSPSDQSMLTEASSSNAMPPLGAPALPIPNRRQSAILSSLHRPGLPLKLDLSSITMGLPHPDTQFAAPVDVAVDLGLTRAPSPVTLAPKTTKTLTNDPTLGMFINPAHHTIPELSVDRENDTFNAPSKLPGPIADKEVIDLTSTDTTSRSQQLGDSADKPIELDIDSGYDDIDLFGDDSSASRIATVHDQSVQDNHSNSIPLAHNLIMGGVGEVDPVKNQSMSLHEGGGPSQSVTDPSVDTIRPMDENSRFNLNNIDFSAFPGLFGGGNGAALPQPNTGSNEDLDIMSQLLAMEGNNQTN